MMRKYAVKLVRIEFLHLFSGDLPRPTLKPTDSRPVLPATFALAYAPYEL